MRIAVRSKSQRSGIGRKLMEYLFAKYYNYLSLDVSTDNDKAIGFYKRIGLSLVETYLSDDKVEFAKFETPKDFIYLMSTTYQSAQYKVEAPTASNINQIEEMKKEEPMGKLDSDAETQSSQSESSEPANVQQDVQGAKTEILVNENPEISDVQGI